VGAAPDVAAVKAAMVVFPDSPGGTTLTAVSRSGVAAEAAGTSVALSASPQVTPAEATALHMAGQRIGWLRG
jgi:hypothetical protein